MGKTKSNGFEQAFRVPPGEVVDLSAIDADYTADFEKKKDAKAELKKNTKKMAELQCLLYAENRRALLVVIQAMDAGGKDGTIRHVMGPLNPQSCKVTSFKTPTEEELAHDFLWRIHRAVPRHGEVGIFNRSHYEDVLIARVHNLVPRKVWSRRFEQINNFERLLTEANCHILKFYLHIDRDEQLKRLTSRLDEPKKHWKIAPEDFAEREHWDDYQAAYEDVLSRCNTEFAPWYVIPANRKWFRNLAVSEIISERLAALGMEYPKPSFDLPKIVVK